MNFFRNNSRDNFILKQISDLQNKSFYFGDSVFIRVSQFDSDKQNISSKILLHSADNLVVAHSGLNACHFYFVLSSLPIEALRTLNKVFIPINLRSFSPQWEFHPNFQYFDEMKRISCQEEISELRVFKELSNRDYGNIMGNYHNFGEQKINFFKNHKVKLNTVNFLDSRSKLFTLHYLYNSFTLKNSTRFVYLRKITQLLSKLSVPHVFFILPINHEGIKFCLGESSLETLSGNVNTLQNDLESNGNSKVLDYHNYLDRFSFFNSLDTTEHLNVNGRNLIINKILN